MSQDKPRSKSVAVVLILLVGLVALIVKTGHMPRLLELIYNPWARLTAVIMLVEYVILKGADRSAIYRRELEAGRARRAEDLRGFQMIESELTVLQKELAGEKTGQGAPGIEAGRERIEKLLLKLRGHI